MILTRKIKVKVVSKNIETYKKLGYDVELGKEIVVNVKDLPLNSRKIVNIKCDNCKITKKIKFCDYMVVFNKKNKYYCSNCKSDSIKDGVNSKYGVDNVFQLESTKIKTKNTCNVLYGFDHHLQNKDILQKQIDTNQKLYGVDFQMQNPENIKKSKKTCLERYGSESNMGDIDILEKCYLSGLRIKKYKETDLYYQGRYEKDFLDKYFDKIKIERGPTLKYEYLGKSYFYHSDFYLSEYNLIVEVKSLWWWEQHKEKNIEKELVCKLNGYNYLIIINKNYEAFNFILNYSK